MSYTSNELALIEGVIGRLYPRMTGEKLKKSYRILHQHLQEGFVNRIDLQRIDSALALADPGQCMSFHPTAISRRSVSKRRSCSAKPPPDVRCPSAHVPAGRFLFFCQ